MKLLIMALLMICLILLIMVLMMISLSKKVMVDKEKSTPFECGFNPMVYTRLPFSIHFFMIAVIFLIFDIEIIMIMPLILTLKSSMFKYWLLTSITFMMILLLGLFHEWNNGMIKWSE